MKLFGQLYELILSLAFSLQENQEGAQGLVISDTELKQVVYAYKCNNSTLQVKGKINSITVGLYTLPAGPPFCSHCNILQFVDIS